MKNEEKARKIVDNIFSIGVNTHISFYEMAYDSAMQMAEWKDRQCLGTLLRVFDLIANKRDAGEALQYIKETMEFIIKDHCGDVDKDKTNKMMMKPYCNLMCIGNRENCISLAPCKEYSNIIHIFSEIDKKEVKNDEQ